MDNRQVPGKGFENLIDQKETFYLIFKYTVQTNNYEKIFYPYSRSVDFDPTYQRSTR